MITPVGFLVTMVIVALIISLLVMLRISSKVADNNTKLMDRIATLEQTSQPQVPDQPQEPTSGTDMLPDILPSDMPLQDLFRWFDNQMDQQRLYCQSDIDLKTTAQHLGMRQRSIIQMLKAIDDKPLTFTEYITAKRLSYACLLLKEKPHWNIDAVAREAGIVSDATFRRLFHKHFSMSPSEYRVRHRNTQTD